jgi:hypothetical protein
MKLYQGCQKRQPFFLKKNRFEKNHIKTSI